MARKNKFNAQRVFIANRWFHSGKEAEWYLLLADRQRKGEIRDLCLQVEYSLWVNGVLICKYVADFTFLEVSSNQACVMDVKGFRTPEYKIKAKLMLACYGIAILEV